MIPQLPGPWHSKAEFRRANPGFPYHRHIVGSIWNGRFIIVRSRHRFQVWVIGDDGQAWQVGCDQADFNDAKALMDLTIETAIIVQNRREREGRDQ